MKIDWAHKVAFQQVKCKCQSHGGNFSSEIVFSHDTCHTAEQGNSNSQVFFVRRPQQAKLGMCYPGPEGRNTAHFSSFNGRNKERENLACPCCSFEPHAMKTLVWMMKLRALFHVRDFAVNIGSHYFQLLTALAAGSFGFFDIRKNRSAPSKHTGVFDVFSRFGNFWEITNVGSHSKTDALTDFSPWSKQFSAKLSVMRPSP